MLNSFKEIIDDTIEYHKAELEKKKAIQKQQEEERIKQEEKRTKQAFIDTYSPALQNHFADALNALPDYLRISKKEINAHVLTNTIEDNSWLLSINIADGDTYSPSKREQLKSVLQNIFESITREAVTDFNNCIVADKTEYQLSLACNPNPSQFGLKTQAHYFSDYQKFFDNNKYRLIKIFLVDIKTDSHCLSNRYTFDMSKVDYFMPANYYWLAGMLNN